MLFYSTRDMRDCAEKPFYFSIGGTVSYACTNGTACRGSERAVSQRRAAEVKQTLRDFT